MHARPRLAVLQAPPGAGKTALLAEAGSRAAAEGHLTLQVPVPLLDSAAPLRDRIVSQLPRRDRWKDLLPELELPLPVGGAGSVSSGRPRTAAVSLLLDGLASLSRRCKPGGRGPAGIFLLLDEAQRLARRDEAAVDLLLEALRDQDGLRTTTILAGLPDTLDAVNSPSLARADRLMDLGPLHRGDSLELLELWLADNGFSAENRDRLDAIAGHAQDWPEHLVHHITAMLREAARRGGTVDADVVERTNAAAEPAMRQYYAARLGVLRGRPLAEQHAVTGLATAAEALPSGLGAAGMREIIERAAESALSVRLAHAGVLVQTDNRWRFAIPSLRDYILRTSDPLPDPLAAAVEGVVAAARR